MLETLFNMEQEEASPIYIKGFNDGYVLHEHEPTLLRDILRSGNEDKEYIRALKSGGRQFEKDQMVKEIKKNIDKDHDQSRGMGF